MNDLDSTRFWRCYRCKVWYPLTLAYFYRKKHSRTGFNNACCVCAKADARNYARRTKELHAKQYAAWYARNKEWKREYNVRWHEANRERRSIQHREWRKAKPEMRRAINANRRARERASEGEYSAGEIIQMYDDQQGLCAYCETVLFGDYEVDHMQPISRGGRNDWTNLALVCQWCNRSKKDKTVEEFMCLR